MATAAVILKNLLSGLALCLRDSVTETKACCQQKDD